MRAAMMPTMPVLLAIVLLLLPCIINLFHANGNGNGFGVESDNCGDCGGVWACYQVLKDGKQACEWRASHAGAKQGCYLLYCRNNRQMLKSPAASLPYLLGRWQRLTFVVVLQLVDLMPAATTLHHSSTSATNTPIVGIKMGKEEAKCVNPVEIVLHIDGLNYRKCENGLVICYRGALGTEEDGGTVWAGNNNGGNGGKKAGMRMGRRFRVNNKKMGVEKNPCAGSGGNASIALAPIGTRTTATKPHWIRLKQNVDNGQTMLEASIFGMDKSGISKAVSVRKGHNRIKIQPTMLNGSSTDIVQQQLEMAGALLDDEFVDIWMVLLDMLPSGGAQPNQTIEILNTHSEEGCEWEFVSAKVQIYKEHGDGKQTDEPTTTTTGTTSTTFTGAWINSGAKNDSDRTTTLGTTTPSTTMTFDPLRPPRHVENVLEEFNSTINLALINGTMQGKPRFLLIYFCLSNETCHDRAGGTILLRIGFHFGSQLRCEMKLFENNAWSAGNKCQNPLVSGGNFLLQVNMTLDSNNSTQLINALDGKLLGEFIKTTNTTSMPKDNTFPLFVKMEGDFETPANANDSLLPTIGLPYKWNLKKEIMKYRGVRYYPPPYVYQQPYVIEIAGRALPTTKQISMEFMQPLRHRTYDVLYHKIVLDFDANNYIISNGKKFEHDGYVLFGYVPFVTKPNPVKRMEPFQLEIRFSERWQSSTWILNGDTSENQHPGDPFIFLVKIDGDFLLLDTLTRQLNESIPFVPTDLP